MGIIFSSEGGNHTIWQDDKGFTWLTDHSGPAYLLDFTRPAVIDDGFLSIPITDDQGQKFSTVMGFERGFQVVTYFAFHLVVGDDIYHIKEQEQALKDWR